MRDICDDNGRERSPAVLREMKVRVAVRSLLCPFAPVVRRRSRHSPALPQVGIWGKAMAAGDWRELRTAYCIAGIAIRLVLQALSRASPVNKRLSFPACGFAEIGRRMPAKPQAETARTSEFVNCYTESPVRNTSAYASSGSSFPVIALN